MNLKAESSARKYKLDVKKPSLLALIVLISFGSIGAALFTPAIPILIDYFGISASLSQMTVTLYLVGYSLGQLIYSPLARCYGRKPALYIGISVSIVGYFLCALSAPLHAFSLLIIARLISALGASAGLSLTFLIISDYFYETHARKITAYTMLAFAVVPGVAIAIGGFLVTYLGWESCFYFLMLYGFFALYLVYRLAETAIEKETMQFKTILTKYKRAFFNPLLLTYSTLIGLTTALVYIFAATAPLIVIRTMGIRPDIFGLLNLIPAVGYFLGNFVAARMANHFEMKTVLKWGLVIMGLGIGLLCVLFFGGWNYPINLFIPVFIIYFGIPLFYSNAAVIATFRSPDKPNASSIMSFFNIGWAVLGVLLIELFHGSLMIIMPAVFLGLYLLFIIIFNIAHRFPESS